MIQHIMGKSRPEPNHGSNPNPNPNPAPAPLYILEEFPESSDQFEYAEESVPTILITGATGNIGDKLRHAWKDRYDMILLDRVSKPFDEEVIIADLTEFQDQWVELFEEVDVVVHLAANPNEFSEWDALVGPNLDALANVIFAAALGGVDRVIFASSNHAMGGYEAVEGPIPETLKPLPDSPYGATKLMGERLGISLSRAFGAEFIALRLGWIQHGENRPETLPHDWARAMWLSNRDLIQLFTRAVEATLPEDRLDFVINGMSDNQGMRWDLTAARTLLGYQPQDGAALASAPAASQGDGDGDGEVQTGGSEDSGGTSGPIPSASSSA